MEMDTLFHMAFVQCTLSPDLPGLGAYGALGSGDLGGNVCAMISLSCLLSPCGNSVRLRMRFPKYQRPSYDVMRELNILNAPSGVGLLAPLHHPYER